MSGTSIVNVVETVIPYNQPLQVFDTIAPGGCIAKAIRVSITTKGNQAVIDFTSILQSGAIDQIQGMYWENCFSDLPSGNIDQVLQSGSLKQALPLSAKTWGYVPLTLTKPDTVTLYNDTDGMTAWQINLIFYNVYIAPAVFNYGSVAPSPPLFGSYFYADMSAHTSQNFAAVSLGSVIFGAASSSVEIDDGGGATIFNGAVSIGQSIAFNVKLLHGSLTIRNNGATPLPVTVTYN